MSSVITTIPTDEHHMARADVASELNTDRSPFLPYTSKGKKSINPTHTKIVNLAVPTIR